jgi:hypothetical protein
MIGPCMCGDLCCPSCGPAQGNWRCIACGAWATDGCACTDAQIQAAAQAEALADEEYAKYCQEQRERGEDV